MDVADFPRSAIFDVNAATTDLAVAILKEAKKNPTYQHLERVMAENKTPPDVLHAYYIRLLVDALRPIVGAAYLDMLGQPWTPRPININVYAILVEVAPKYGRYGKPTYSLWNRIEIAWLWSRALWLTLTRHPST